MKSQNFCCSWGGGCNPSHRQAELLDLSSQVENHGCVTHPSSQRRLNFGSGAEHRVKAEMQVNSVLTHGNEHLGAEFPYRHFRTDLEQPQGCSAGSVLSMCCPWYPQTAHSRWMSAQCEFGSWQTCSPGELCDT